MRLESIVGHVLELCLLFEQEQKPTDQIAWKFFKDREYLGARDRFRIREAVFGMQRNKRFDEWLADEFFNHHPKIKRPDSVHLKFLPRYIVQAHFINKHPAEDMITGLGARWEAYFPGSTLAEYLEWIKIHQLTISHLANPVERFGIQYSFPDWIVERFLSQYGDETEELLQGLNHPARVTLRVNLLKVSREQCIQSLKEDNVEATPTQYSHAGLVTTSRFNRHALKAFKQGWFEIQDEGSQIISLITGAKPGEFVIDACAGGGGKTLHLVEMMQDRGTLLAVDIDEKRMKGLDTRVERTGIKIIRSLLVQQLNAKELSKRADLVLIDAPCSGVGRIRRNPDLKWKLVPHLVTKYPQRQFDILRHNAEYVKPGGRLIYATCSLFRSENEEVIERFLETKKEFTLKSPEPYLQPLGIEIGSQYVNMLPHKFPTDGFFVAIMERNS